jgi:hypothetical protein
LPVRQLTVGPPVRRFETPCPYSWKIVSERKSASRIAGRSRLRCTLPSAGRPPLIALPAAWEIATAGMPTAGSIEPLRIGGSAVVLWAITSAAAPAFSAFTVRMCALQVVELSTSAIAPSATSYGSQPSLTGSTPSFASTIVPSSPAFVGAGVKRA